MFCKWGLLLGMVDEEFLEKYDCQLNTNMLWYEQRSYGSIWYTYDLWFSYDFWFTYAIVIYIYMIYIWFTYRLKDSHAWEFPPCFLLVVRFLGFLSAGQVHTTRSSGWWCSSTLHGLGMDWGPKWSWWAVGDLWKIRHPKTNGWRAPKWWALEKVTGPF